MVVRARTSNSRVPCSLTVGLSSSRVSLSPLLARVGVDQQAKMDRNVDVQQAIKVKQNELLIEMHRTLGVLSNVNLVLDDILQRVETGGDGDHQASFAKKVVELNAELQQWQELLPSGRKS